LVKSSCFCLAAQGHRVLAISRTIPQALLGNETISCLSVDLAIEEDLQKVVDYVSTTWKHVDAIVHNAGSLLLKPFSETSQADFESIYKVNVFGVANLTRVVLTYLQKGSHVVTISSMGGIQGSLKFAGLAAYSSSTEMLAEAFPGYEAPISAADMAKYIVDFTLTGNQYFNGKVLQVSSSNP
jgi:NAD(P)-dependent dehydrogenase (short-subunit alcohol dehydrogenase family)